MFNTMDFISDDIINFYANYLIKNSESPEKYLLLENFLPDMFESNNDTISNINFTNEKIMFLPINYSNLHWQLIIIINILDNEKETTIMFMDSSSFHFNIKRRMHFNKFLERETTTQEEFIIKFLVALLSFINPNKAILEMKYID